MSILGTGAAVVARVLQSTSSSSFTEDWWIDLAVPNDTYVPAVYEAGNAVDISHNVLGNARDNEYDLDEASYTEGIAYVFSIFMVVGIIACVCIPVGRCCIWRDCCCCECLIPDQVEKVGSEKWIKWLFVFFSLLGLAGTVGAVYGFVNVDEAMSRVTSTSYGLSDDMNQAVAIADDTLVTVEGVRADLDSVTDAAGDCGAPDSATDAFSDFDDYLAGVEEELVAVQNSGFISLAEQVTDIANETEDWDGVRRGVVWTLLAVCMVGSLGYIGLSFAAVRWGVTKGGASEWMRREERVERWAHCVVNPCSLIIVIAAWVMAALAITLAAFSGDFCVDPDAHIVDALDNDPDATYYAGDCTGPNTVLDPVLRGQLLAVENVPMIIPAVDQVVEFCSDASDSADSLEQGLFSIWQALAEAADLASCRNLNGAYAEAVYEGLCRDLTAGLTALWVSVVILACCHVFLGLLWSLFNKSKERELAHLELNAWEDAEREKHQAARAAAPQPDALRAPSAGVDEVAVAGGGVNYGYHHSAGGPEGHTASYNKPDSPSAYAMDPGQVAAVAAATSRADSNGRRARRARDGGNGGGGSYGGGDSMTAAVLEEHNRERGQARVTQGVAMDSVGGSSGGARPSEPPPYHAFVPEGWGGPGSAAAWDSVNGSGGYEHGPVRGRRPVEALEPRPRSRSPVPRRY